MVGWHHQLSRYDSEQALGDDEGQGSLACCSHGVAESDMKNSNNSVFLIYKKQCHLQIKQSNFQQIKTPTKEQYNGLKKTQLEDIRKP